MKKNYLLYLFLFCLGTLSLSQVFAVPTLSGFVKVKQADGKYITVQKYGDEYFNYETTIDGYTVTQKEGLYYHTTISPNGTVTISNVRASDPGQRGASESAFLSAKTKAAFAFSASAINSASRTMRETPYGSKFPSEGEVKSLIILVNFKNVKMQSHNTRSAFENMLNQKGYSYNSATGSAKDYFEFNSMNQFLPTFDVVGPYELSQNMAYYGGNDAQGNDKNVRGMVAEACNLAAAAGVDFSQYDFDNNGQVDNVYFFYAGYAESATGVSPDAIWPHKWTATRGQYLNGKEIYTYACSSELRTNAGTIRSGIGTFCHEFSHVLGLSDIYDTSGGSKGALGIPGWNVMTDGNYNNQGRTPPLYCAFEREDVGWIELEPLAEGENVLAPLSSNKAYKVSTSTPGEYFTYENRNKTANVWDQYGPGTSSAGLLILHIDKSSKTYGGLTSISRWSSNKVNNNPDHMCARMVISNPNGWNPSSKDALFPGSTNNTSFGYNSAPAALDWAKKPLERNISNIRVSGKDIVFTADDGKSITTDASQNRIALSWMDPSSIKWQVSYKVSTESLYSTPIATTTASFVISELMPSTTYDIKVASSKDGTTFTDLFLRQITTLALVEAPAVASIPYQISANTPVVLSVSNLDNNNKVVWKVNGTVQSSNIVTLSAGEQKITGTFTTKGKEYTVIKYVLVN